MKASLDWDKVSKDAYEAYDSGDYVNAQRLLIKAMPQLGKSSESEQQEARACMTVAHCLATTGDNATAEMHFRRAIHLYRHSDAGQTAYCYYWLGICLFRMKHWLEAALTFTATLEWLARSGASQDLSQLADLETYAAHSFWCAKKADKAVQHFAAALKLCAQAATPLACSAWLVRCLLDAVRESADAAPDIVRMARRACGLLGRKLADIDPPKTKRGRQRDQYFGTAISDPYRWLEKTGNEEVKEWVAAQDKRAEQFLDNIPGRTILHHQVHALFQHADPYVPSKVGRWYFFEDKPVGHSRQRFCRVRKLGQFAQVVIDADKLPVGDLLAWTRVSPDARYVAYAVAPGGSQWETVRIRNMNTGKDLPQQLKGLRHLSLQWAPDAKGFYYCAVQRDDPQATQKIYYHELRRSRRCPYTGSVDDILLHEQKVADVVLGICAVVQKKYLLVSTSRGSTLTYSMLLQPLAKAAPPLVLFEEGPHEFQLYNNWDGRLYFITDREAQKRRLISVQIPKGRWRKPIVREEIPQWKHVLRYAWPCKKFCTGVYVTERGTVLRRVARDGRLLGETFLPPHTSIIRYTGAGYPRMFFKVEGYTQAPTVLEYNAESGVLKPFGKHGCHASYERFETQTIYATSKDGTKVPVHVSYKRGLKRNGDHPLLLTAYGGFNRWAEPSYDQYNVVWMEHGGVIAEAAIRGGGEFGRKWRMSATREHKQNCFDDFIAAAESLIEHEFTRPARLGVVGGSNGGLLAGAVLTQRPELFAAVQITCGLLDMLRYHQFDLARYYIAEYGCANDRKMFDVLRQYSPLHRLRKRDYPATLIATGADDDLVSPAHSYKFTAAMQSLQTASAPVLLRVEGNAGHAGHHRSGRGVDRLAFFAHTLGLMPDALLRDAAMRWKKSSAKSSGSLSRRRSAASN